MEEPDSEWAIQEHPSSSGMLKWILNRGYGIGKKMVVTGIVVSSAPLVLPPLVVFSAMGVAFSVPFGLVFATYACTNKLMTKLLPTHPEAPLLLDQPKKEQGLFQYRQSEGGNLVTQDMGHQEDGGEPRTGYIEERAEIRFDLAGGKKVDQEYESMKNVEDDGRFPKEKDDIVIEGEEKEGIRQRVGQNVDGDERVQGSGLIRDFGVDEQGYEEDVGEYLEGDDDDDDSLEEERKELDETEEIVKGSTGLLEKIRDQGRREEKKAVEKESKDNRRNISKMKKEAGDKKTANDNVDIVVLPSSKPPKMPFREANLDEEKIWENIGAMRAIVGYKAPSEATYVGELKALYAFTGVEPPASFKGDSNLDEVNANLKFLMSIVGVK